MFIQIELNAEFIDHCQWPICQKKTKQPKKKKPKTKKQKQQFLITTQHPSSLMFVQKRHSIGSSNNLNQN